MALYDRLDRRAVEGLAYRLGIGDIITFSAIGRSDCHFDVFRGDRTSAFRKSGLSDFLNISDTTQAEFAKIPIARVFLGAIH